MTTFKMMRSSPPKTLDESVCVVVVTYQGAKWIRRCLSSLLQSTHNPYVIVVDNASTDDTVHIVQAEFPDVALLQSGRNLGFGRGNNLGISLAMNRGAQFVFLLNQDAYVLPTTIAELVTFMQREPSFGVVAPMHCSPDPDSIDRKTLRGYLQTYLPEYLADACVGRVKDHYKTQGVNAAAWFVRSEVFSQAGGFDPLFFLYGEDDDLLCRWMHHGVAFAWFPASRVVHLRESPRAPLPTFWADIKRRARRRRSNLLVAVKRPHFGTGHMALVFLAEGFVAPLVDALVLRQPREWMASVLAACGLVFEFPNVVRHARLTARPGAHFL